MSDASPDQAAHELEGAAITAHTIMGAAMGYAAHRLALFRSDLSGEPVLHLHNCHPHTEGRLSGAHRLPPSGPAALLQGADR